MPSDFFEPLTFGELKVGDKFICLPLPGDNKGHGGFRGKYYIFIKNHPREDSDCPELSLNNTNFATGRASHSPNSMLVIKVRGII